MNDLSSLKNIKFQVTESDYGNCFDIGAKGFTDGRVSSPQMVRHFLARIDKKDLPALIKALNSAVDE